MTTIETKSTTQDRAVELTMSLEQRLFCVVYQPIVERVTGRIVAIEALVRHQRDGRLEEPDTFLADVEELGLQHRLAAVVYMTGLRDLRDLRAAGLVDDDVRLHVNVSAAQLDDEARIDEVVTCATRLGLPYGALAVELTESCALHMPALAARMLADCRSRGVPVALDDIGAGYSSLALLKTITVDELKIDRSFVTDIVESAPCQAVVAGIVAITRRLGIIATAEGVETGEQRRVLVDLGVDRLQGHLYHRPMRIDALRAQLRLERDNQGSAAAS